jgi:hypothetical protein
VVGNSVSDVDASGAGVELLAAAPGVRYSLATLMISTSAPADVTLVDDLGNVVYPTVHAPADGGVVRESFEPDTHRAATGSALRVVSSTADVLSVSVEAYRGGVGVSVPDPFQQQVFAPGQPPTEPLSPFQLAALGLGPVAYYRLGERSGTVLNDSSGNGQHGTYVGAPVLGETPLIAGTTDRAVRFTDNTGGQYGTVPDDSPLRLDGVNGATVAFWWRTTTVDHQIHLSKRVAGAVSGYQAKCHPTTGEWEFRVFDGTEHALFSGVNVCDGTRHFIVVKWSGSGDFTVRIDGVTVVTQTEVVPAASSGRPLFIGADGIDAIGAVATMDEVVLYDRELTDAQDAALYAAGL